MPEPLPHGKICYIEIPANDIATSSTFYNKAFGWKIRTRGDGATAFDDATGYVSGAWVLNRAKSPSPGLLIYIAVSSVAATCELIPTLGGAIVQPIGADPGEITARFQDPAGNVLGLYQNPD